MILIIKEHRASQEASTSTSTRMAALAVVNSILALNSLIPALPQSVTNGATDLGTLSAPTYLSGVDGKKSWGDDTVVNTNPYEAGPVTGKYEILCQSDFV